MDRRLYDHKYDKSWALVIGINEYEHAGPLDYACNDAKAIQDVLIRKYSFPEDNITLLLDSQATKQNIEQEYCKYTDNRTGPDDRLIFFFAGHGHTLSGHRGEIGCLVPSDGDSSDLATLLRWGEITSTSELISAKHILYIMDACYSGLAITRHAAPGTVRFANSMFERLSRQVIAAGKANEEVSDGGGPRPGHSVFTGHLLEALNGGVMDTEGILTANQVMGYVYKKVAQDYQSNQTPHYGHIDGDGDFIFQYSPDILLNSEDRTDSGAVVKIPSGLSFDKDDTEAVTENHQLKQYLSDAKNRILLDDFVMAQVKNVVPQLGHDLFPVEFQVTQDEFQSRLLRYEEIVRDLIGTVSLLGRWGADCNRATLESVFARVSDANPQLGGTVVWLGFRWYPITLLMYSAGISALKSDNYDNLISVLMAEAAVSSSRGSSKRMIQLAVDGMLETIRGEFFKRLPDHDRLFVPMNEYIYRTLLPIIEENVYLGNEYEKHFDTYEVLQALVYADMNYDDRGEAWGPLGRFAYKYNHRGRITEDNPYSNVLAEAERMQGDWPLIQKGLFEGSYERFQEISKGLSEFMVRLNWH